jgi:ATP-binding cassette, subfamily C, bacterial LapB
VNAPLAALALPGGPAGLSDGPAAERAPWVLRELAILLGHRVGSASCSKRFRTPWPTTPARPCWPPLRALVSPIVAGRAGAIACLPRCCPRCGSRLAAGPRSWSDERALPARRARGGRGPERVHAIALPGELHVFAGRDEALEGADRPLLPRLLSEHTGPIAGLAALSVLSGVTSIALGLVVMIAFDMVIPGGQAAPLLLLGAGFLGALACDLALRSMLARGLGRIGERAERRVLGLVFAKVLRLPLPAVTAQDPAAQVMRMRDLEASREVFTGPLPQLVLQVPLVVVFLGVIWALAGPSCSCPC